MSRKSSRSSSSVERDGDLIDFVARIWNKTASEPYYLLHFLVFFSYIPIRFSAAGVLSPSRSGTLLIREIQAVVAFCILTVIKLVREETWETFIANTFFFAKIFLAAIAFVMDYHVALWYTLAFLVIYLSAQQPPHEGLGDLNHLTPLQLETLLTEGNMSRFWLVEFRASSVSSCIRTSSFFPELSITYSNKRLSFGTVDLGLFPNAAEKFGISLDSLNQLPIYKLFDNGTEVSSLSEVDFETYILSPSLTKKHLCRHFELDKLLLDYVNGK
ncbi:thioredoxin-related transmembrane protein 2 isoform X1 [Coffea eugenioides]|uniref:thioredoxin-related transmembrane protein 2 isoform X1 n=1 Tax=Coffea eugenioides TaxID=49369 RepID=UPI000F606EE5|nr:thioredoxin-related transmembrane protein 2 isoform X1 [Coffea eugenioides]